MSGGYSGGGIMVAAGTKDEANKTLSYEDKVRWAELQNSKANLYFIKHGNIEDVPAEGWWY